MLWLLSAKFGRRNDLIKGRCTTSFHLRFLRFRLVRLGVCRDNSPRKSYVLIESSSYNIGILASIYVHPGFKHALHNPSKSKLAHDTGLITAIYYLGTWLSYLFLSHPASDHLGRRYAALTGMLVNCVGAALLSGASGSGAFAMLIIGRIICGLGIAIVSTSVPLYQRFVHYHSITDSSDSPSS